MGDLINWNFIFILTSLIKQQTKYDNEIIKKKERDNY